MWCESTEVLRQRAAGQASVLPSGGLAFHALRATATSLAHSGGSLSLSAGLSTPAPGIWLARWWALGPGTEQGNSGSGSKAHHTDAGQHPPPPAFLLGTLASAHPPSPVDFNTMESQGRETAGQAASEEIAVSSCHAHARPFQLRRCCRNCLTVSFRAIFVSCLGVSFSKKVKF